MLRIVAFTWLAFFLVVFSPGANAAQDPQPEENLEPARLAAAASSVAALTGIAISPLLGTGVYGAYKYMTTHDVASRAALPWFASPAFFVPALIIAGLCAAKDTFGVVFPPGLKKPLDVMELIENKISGLIAAGAVLPITISTLEKVLMGPSALAHPTGFPAGVAMIGLGAVDTSSLMNGVTMFLGVVAFAMVWMASHAINVLILLSPWGAIDATLKGARTAVLGLIALTAHLDPWSTLILCLIIFVAAYGVSGWAFRLMVFGTVFSWDYLTGRRDDLSAAGAGHRVFSSTAMTERKVPIRTYGELVKAGNGRHRFRYRPWLIFPTREVEIADASVKIGRGVFFSTVLAGGRALFLLPPRYVGDEERIATLYGFEGVEDAGLRKAWGWLREALGLEAASKSSSGL